jgi:type IV pilus assembly protein PilZ
MISFVSAPEDPENRRGEPRHPIVLKVEYKRLNAFFADYTKNISRGGTFIQTSKPLPIDTEFVFKLFVPQLEQPLKIRGLVKWIIEPGEDDGASGASAPGMGIRFIYATGEERSKVERLVEELMVNSLGEQVYRKLMSRGEGGDGGAGGAGG